MSATTYELIGRIIDPRPATARVAAVLRPMAADAPLPVLIGRILGPPAAAHEAPQARAA
jgi:hypothetical protein